jgi:hypothetical protein
MTRHEHHFLKTVTQRAQANLEVATPHTNSSFSGDKALLDELDVDIPDALVLRDRQCAQRTIKRMTCSRNQLLRYQKLQILDPDARHLVQKHQRALKHRIHRIKGCIRNALAAHLEPALRQVLMPQLVAARQFAKRSLMKNVSDLYQGGKNH